MVQSAKPDRTSRRPSKDFFWWAWNLGFASTGAANIALVIGLGLFWKRHHDPSLRPWNVASWTIDENPPLVDDFPSYKRPYLQTISCHVGLLDSNWGSDLEQVFLSIFNGKTLGLTECHSGHRSAFVVVWGKLLDFGLDSGMMVETTRLPEKPQTTLGGNSLGHPQSKKNSCLVWKQKIAKNQVFQHVHSL